MLTPVPDPSPAAPAPEVRRAAAGFEALLFERMLRPLTTSMGFFGEVATAALAGAVAERSGGALRERLEALLDGAR